MFISNDFDQAGRKSAAHPVDGPPLSGQAPPAQTEWGATHLCAYVRADPINFTDPLGLQDGQDILVTGTSFCVRNPSQCAKKPEPGDSSPGGPGGAGGNRGGPLVGKIGIPPKPPKEKKLSQCIVAFMNRTGVGFDWSNIKISSADPLPGQAATNWGDVINVGSRFETFESDKRLAFHELAHSPQWASGGLTRYSYIGSAMINSMRSLGRSLLGQGSMSVRQIHDSIPAEKSAMADAAALWDAYKAEGKPCE